ncbi:MAG TPA: type III pantothenate kinase [Candidatus Avirikenella pullistercoris]|nr:type III pantothenate kinase [Candidatus Avirikenella pullistercoris]
MNLIIDIGNSCAKVAVMAAGKVTYSVKSESLTENIIAEVLKKYPGISAAIMCSVKATNERVKDFLNREIAYFLDFDHATPVPIENCYETPRTLGLDRLAAAVGAKKIFGTGNILVIDFGSAITIDWIEEGKFMGGNISPGASLRFKSLHDYTDKLPLCKLQEESGLLGKTTHSAIENGVINGIVYEIKQYIERFTKNCKEPHVIFTGGDGKYFADKLKNTIFVSCDLVFLGLNEVLEYNNALRKEV